MKYTLALLSLGTAVLAQNGTASSPSSSANSPYIPDSGVSDTCADFLHALDSNSDLAACSSGLLSATSLFDPTNSGSSQTSDAQVTGTLRKLCSASSACSDTLIKQSLTYFNGNCSKELAANNAVVKSNYDVLYTLKPFTDAVCTKDATGAYCATQIGQASSGASSSNSSTAAPANSTVPATQQLLVQAPHIALQSLYINLSEAAMNAVKRLRKRQQTATAANATSMAHTTSVGDDDALLPNATTFRATNLPFLFLSGDMSSNQLCVPCTKSILAAYVAWETEYPYSTGLSSSPILGGQAALWNQIGGVCGSGFLSAITQQAGTHYSSGALKTAGISFVSLGAAALAFLVL